MSRLKVKVCGMTDLANVKEVVALAPDYLGYIFYPKSSRYVGLNPDIKIFSEVGDSIQKVGVFVNEEPEKVKVLINKFGLDVVQLHGTETPEICYEMKKSGVQVIKAIPSNELAFGDLLMEYVDAVDYLLFDTPTELYGGSGKKFNWTGLKDLKLDGSYFLSGGIGLEDATAIRKLMLPDMFGVDVNSGFEIAPGMKDVGLVERFLKSIRDGEE